MALSRQELKENELSSLRNRIEPHRQFLPASIYSIKLLHRFPMSQTPNPSKKEVEIALSLLSRFNVSMNQGLPLEESLKTFFAPVNVVFSQCFPLQRCHSEAVDATVNPIFLTEHVRGCSKGGDPLPNDNWSRERYEIRIAAEKVAMWRELEQRLGRGIFLMAPSLDWLDQK